MDSAAFAKTSQANGLEYIVIKVVLDNADENAKADFDRNFTRFCGRPAELICEVLKTHYIDK
jgi:nucleoside phosphorylase